MAPTAFDEMGPPGACRPQYERVQRWLAETPIETMEIKRREAEDQERRQREAEEARMRQSEEERERADREARKALEERYNATIAAADAAMASKSWTEARGLYAQAGDLKPEET